MQKFRCSFADSEENDFEGKHHEGNKHMELSHLTTLVSVFFKKAYPFSTGHMDPHFWASTLHFPSFGKSCAMLSNRTLLFGTTAGISLAKKQNTVILFKIIRDEGRLVRPKT